MKKLKVFVVCGFIHLLVAVATPALDISWEPGPNTQLLLSGDIETGDAEKFRRFMSENFERYKKSRFIRLASNGGSLVEALRIAELMKSIYPNVIVEKEKCASACFFLYLSGVNRYVVGTSQLGVHRPYFDPTYFANLKPDAAKVRQQELQRMVDTILDDNSVPQSLKEKMNRTSSSEIYWLSKQDIDSIGDKPAWFEELLIAKCDYGTYKALWKKMRIATPGGSQHEAYSKELERSGRELVWCEEKVIGDELSRLPGAFVN